MKILIYLIIATISDHTLSDDRPIDLLLRKMNEELLRINSITAKLEWESSMRSSREIFSLKRKFSRIRSAWRNEFCNKFNYYRDEGMANARMIYLLCRGPVYSTNEARALMSVSDKLVTSYSTRKICRMEINEEKCYHSEPDLKMLMSKSRNESELLWAWTSWRDEMSSVKELFAMSVDLQNIGARNNGYKDIGECWREELEIPNLENFVNNLYDKIEHLYRLLHAVVRYRLGQIYPNVAPGRPIPAHLLGNLWSQNWESLIDLILPNTKNVLNITESLRKKNYTVKDMVKHAENYYLSLGFPPLTAEFWSRSSFTANNSSDANCHATAANMFEKNDYRIIACLGINSDDFYVIHHEIGHIQYYMAYEKQPAIFRNGVNSAVHEAIGDSILLGVMTSQHLHRLGLADDAILTDGNKRKHFLRDFSELAEVDLSILLRQALAKLPEIPYALLIDKWRWRIFAGDINSSNYNALWWELHKRYMGIEPPEPRDEFFDAGAKFHIVSNTPYIRYFIANILQYQLFESMCEVGITGKLGDPKFSMKLHRCDIYGSKNAAKRLRSLMSFGSAVDWRKWIFEVTGKTEINERSLLRYYEPVKKWLESEIERLQIPIGWN